MSHRLVDLLALRTLPRMLAEAGSASRLRAALWRQAVVPRLPEAARALWYAREERRVRHLPPWLHADFATRAAVAEAIHERQRRSARATFEERLTFLLGRPATVGSRAAYDVIAAREGVETSSPLLDARIVALVVDAPPELRTTRDRSKRLLRLAMQNRLPPQVLAHTKHVAFHDHLERRTLRDPGESARLRDTLAACAPLEGALDLPALDRFLRLALSDAPLDADLLARLLALYDFAAWSARIEREYAIVQPPGW